jgi:CRISPR-associated protein Cst2
MSKHLYGLIVTPHGIAANNRGEGEGNITTLQKLLWRGEVHTTVSAEAIRWAIRWHWQRTRGEKELNRRWKEDVERAHHEWADRNFEGWHRFIDDDVLGFMSAEAAKEEANPEESKQSKRGKQRGKTLARRARLEVTRAISLTPFAGDITFNAASVGATPSASATGRDPVPYGAEVHATRYQYAFALTPAALKDPTRAIDVLDSLIDLSSVGGNHARFLFDFAPDSVIFRWTEDFAPRILYAFDLDAEGTLSVPEIRRRVDAGDIKAEELVIGGALSRTSDGKALGEAGASVHDGVKAAAEKIKKELEKP